MGTSEINGKLWGERAQTWADLQEQTARPLYAHVLAALKVGPDTKYLDVGCGSGMAIELAAKLGAATSGLDASPALITVAKSRVPSADVRRGDLETLPFADATFDLVTGFNSFQYASQPKEALREAARVTKKGGHVVIATWSPPELTQASKLLAALKPLLPTPPPGAPGPFALSDRDALFALATSAGLHPIDTTDVESPFGYPDLKTGVLALNSSGVSARAIAHSGEEAVSKAHEAALREFVQPDGSVLTPNRFRYLLTQVA